MSDTYVTLRGWVGDVTSRFPGGVSVVNLRVASTPRFKRDGDWVDGETTWYTVTAWREFADNIRGSVRKGDPVLVHGRLRTRVWDKKDGGQGLEMVVDASLVGHDLARGISRFSRAPRPQPAQDGANGAHGVDGADGAGGAGGAGAGEQPDGIGPAQASPSVAGPAGDWGAVTASAGSGEHTGPDAA